jgi:hypothetical protein
MKNSGFYVPVGLFLIFSILKLSKIIAWSWWWIFSPLIVLLAIYIVIFFIIITMRDNETKHIFDKINGYNG